MRTSGRICSEVTDEEDEQDANADERNQGELHGR